MLKHKESVISAHHNYLVDNMLMPGFVLGDPNSFKDFHFLADLVLPGESTPRVSGRLFDSQGVCLLELNWNRIMENPGQCTYQSTSGGFYILLPSGEPLLKVNTQKFANGYLTRIQGRLHDQRGSIRMEMLYDSIQVHGEAPLLLDAPFVFSRKPVKSP
ncbi:MAG: hypothetical protein ABIG67_00015 [Pseudomonadota bacterium]